MQPSFKMVTIYTRPSNPIIFITTPHSLHQKLTWKQMNLLYDAFDCNFLHKSCWVEKKREVQSKMYPEVNERHELYASMWMRNGKKSSICRCGTQRIHPPAVCSKFTQFRVWRSVHLFCFSFWRVWCLRGSPIAAALDCCTEKKTQRERERKERRVGGFAVLLKKVWVVELLDLIPKDGQR